MKYEEAMKKLETIVSDVEEGKLDIDVISEKLKEAQELIKFCKDKLYQTDREIQELLSDGSKEM
ncbi:MAG: exodeoxyribonuclease VII small subunit [Bacteroidaceae bacterium]|nr:exodeoxyribonuclease VII small subunit [Bacteroidaceae bacterium]